MIRIAFGFVAAVVALVSVSCCCTGESKAPPLPALPKFQEIEAAPAPQVHYEK